MTYAHHGFLIKDLTSSSSILQSHILHQKIKIKVKPGAPVWKVEWVYWEDLNRRLVCLFQKLSPALLKELPHVMTSSTNVWIVFIKFFAVIKDQVDVNDESLQVLILAAHKLLTYGGEVHRFLDDLPVAGDRFQVDRCEKRPCILMPLQLSKENPA